MDKERKGTAAPNKGTRVGWPFKTDSPLTREIRRLPHPAQPVSFSTHVASPSLSPSSPGDWSRLSPRREGGTEDLLSDWPIRGCAGHVLGDVSRQFRLVSHSLQRERSLLRESENPSAPTAAARSSAAMALKDYALEKGEGLQASEGRPARELSRPAPVDVS